jgi:hypothetical protein
MTDKKVLNQIINNGGRPEKDVDLDVIAKAIRDSIGCTFTCENAADIFGCDASTIERKLKEKYGPNMTWGRFKKWHRKAEAIVIVKRLKLEAQGSEKLLLKLADAVMDEAAEIKKPEIEINITNKYLDVPEEKLIQLLQTAQQALTHKIETKTIELTKGNDYEREPETSTASTNESDEPRGDKTNGSTKEI